MKIVVKKSNLPCELKEVNDLPLEDMQSLVGGFVECIRFNDEKNIDLWCNDEGKLHNLPPNIALVRGNQIVDIIQGDAFFASVDEEGGTIGLTDEQAEAIRDSLGIVMSISDTNGEVGYIQCMSI